MSLISLGSAYRQRQETEEHHRRQRKILEMLNSHWKDYIEIGRERRERDIPQPEESGLTKRISSLTFRQIVYLLI